MPSQAMQDAIDALRDRRRASASQAPPTLEERRAAFTPADRLLRTISRLVEPTKGRIDLNGRDVRHQDPPSCGGGSAT